MSINNEKLLEISKILEVFDIPNKFDELKFDVPSLYQYLKDQYPFDAGLAVGRFRKQFTIVQLNMLFNAHRNNNNIYSNIINMIFAQLFINHDFDNLKFEESIKRGIKYIDSYVSTDESEGEAYIDNSSGYESDWFKSYVDFQNIKKMCSGLYMTSDEYDSLSEQEKNEIGLIIDSFYTSIFFFPVDEHAEIIRKYASYKYVMGVNVDDCINRVKEFLTAYEPKTEFCSELKELYFKNNILDRDCELIRQIYDKNISDNLEKLGISTEDTFIY